MAHGLYVVGFRDPTLEEREKHITICVSKHYIQLVCPSSSMSSAFGGKGDPLARRLCRMIPGLRLRVDDAQLFGGLPTGQVSQVPIVPQINASLGAAS